jgi:signal transduction histidine kinase
LKTDNDKNIYLRELRTVLKFSALINSSLKIEAVLNNAMQWAEEFINAEASSIYELDEETNELFIRLARGEKKDPIKGIRLKKGEGIAGRVVETGQPKVVHDVTKEKDFSDKFDKLTGFKTKSLICVPLILRDKTIGAIQVLNKKTQEPFSNADLEILTSMSQQIAVAMENAKLFHRLEKKFELTAEELKTTQEKLIRSERLAAMGHLVDGVAHEIRNPITIIGGLAQRIKARSNRDISLIKYTEIILQETARLERLVRQVHELSEIQSAVPVAGQLTPVIEEVLNRYRALPETRNVILTSDIEKNLPLIELDSKQIITAISNIIENALEAIHEHGEISIKAFRNKDDFVTILIKDTGFGIDQEELPSIYDPFVTSKTHGAGLGLTMVHQIVMNHNGEIHIDSMKAKGTTVTIKLPLSHYQNLKEIEG